jgi:tetratricopeptide (TPR) repeat protein
VELGLAQAGNKQCPEAENSLKKGIEMDAASKKPDPGLEGAANDKLGECYATDGKIPESQAAYDAAAKVNPSGAGMYYTNATIMMDRASGASPAASEAVPAMADKAIAANPNNAIPYYLKGKALIQKASVDQKTGKIVAPPGCQEAYEKYLQLAPTGQFAADAKQVLSEMSSTQSSSYKASKKH